jgi:DNA-binding transcriptional regulator YdaS (Cro superfamily)
MNRTQLREHIALAIAAHDATMAALVAVKPAVTDGHSDGRRVKYVRAETAAATLRAVLAALEGSAS